MPIVISELRMDNKSQDSQDFGNLECFEEISLTFVAMSD